jgi:hypothetical protein
MKFVVRDLPEGTGIRITDTDTGATRSLTVFEKFGGNAVLLVTEPGEFLSRKRIRVGDDPTWPWPDLGVKLFRRDRDNAWRFAFQVPDHLKLDRIDLDRA